MDLIKQYLIQSISNASNNLRLSNEKIEVVALLRDSIIRTENLEEDFRRMKTVTELSTLAIRLNEIYNYLNGQVDILKLSDKFKEHSQILIKDLSHMLEIVNPVTFKQAIDKVKNNLDKIEKVEVLNSDDRVNGINIDLSQRDSDPDVFEKHDESRKKLILEGVKDDKELLFDDFEETILKPVKPLDSLLKHLTEENINSDELENFAKIMKQNGEASHKNGFEILSSMHQIIAQALMLINQKQLPADKNVIEAVRACLIVIVTVIRGKEVDITNYLNLAEDFGNQISRFTGLNIKDEK